VGSFWSYSKKNVASFLQTVYNMRKLFSVCMSSVAWWCKGQGIGLAIKRWWVQIQAVPLSCNDLGQVVHTHVPLSPSSMVVMLFGWEGNRGPSGKWWQPTTAGFMTCHLRADRLETGISSGLDAHLSLPYLVHCDDCYPECAAEALSYCHDHCSI